MDSKPACPLPTSSASLLLHRHSAKLSSRSTFFGIAKTRTKLDLLSPLRVTWLFLSTYRVLRNKNIKQNRNRCNRCTVTVYPDRPWQAPGHLSTAQFPDLNNVRLAMEQNVLDSAIEPRICPSLTNQGALNTVCEHVCLLPSLSVCRLALVVQHKYLFHGHDASQHLLLRMAHAQTSTFSFATAQPDVQQAPPAVPVHLSLSPRCLMLL